MVPIAPTRFSTTNCWPNTSLKRWQVSRAILSMLPPAAKPTNTLTGFCGHACASAGEVDREIANEARRPSVNLREIVDTSATPPSENFVTKTKELTLCATRRRRSLVAIHALAALVPLLRFDRK